MSEDSFSSDNYKMDNESPQSSCPLIPSTSTTSADTMTTSADHDTMTSIPHFMVLILVLSTSAIGTFLSFFLVRIRNENSNSIQISNNKFLSRTALKNCFSSPFTVQNVWNRRYFGHCLDPFASRGINPILQ